jgi:hypothetical protein
LPGSTLSRARPLSTHTDRRREEGEEEEALIPAMILTRGNKIAYSWTNQEKRGRRDRMRGKGMILKKTMNLVGSPVRLIVKIYRRRRVENDRSKAIGRREK